MERVTLQELIRQASDLGDDSEPIPYQGVLLVTAAEKRVDKRGKFYLAMTLQDRTGSINCMMWKEEEWLPQQGSVIGVIGQIKKFNGRLQMKAEEISRNPENVVMSELIPAAPDTPETMRAMVEETIDSMQSGELKKLVREMLRMAGDRLDYYPAAMVIHHAERSGLLHHITDMLRMAERMVECYPFLNRDLLLAGVIVHDLGKIDEMVSDGMGRVQDHTRDGVLIGHLVRGVANLEVAGRNTQVTGEWLTLLQHMLISHHGVPEYGSPQQPKIPEAEALFLLDTLDSKMAIYQGILQELPEGAISERKAALENRRIYHPLYRDGAE